MFVMPSTGHFTGRAPLSPCPRPLSRRSRFCSLEPDRKQTRCYSWWPWNDKEKKTTPVLSDKESSTNTTPMSGGRGAVVSSRAEEQMEDDSEYELHNIMSLDEASPEEWNQCLTSSAEENPFLLHEFLSGLEKSGCTVLPLPVLSAETCVLIRRLATQLVGCCPLYVKSHSQGEYVFDYQWAQLSAYTGKRYYPKLQSCVPFTPVTGSRLLVNSDDQEDATIIRRSLALGLKAVADALDVSSAHLTFNSENEQKLLEEEGYIGRVGLQYHWENRDYETFDEFLMDLKQSKRKNIRQERKSMKKADIEIERLVGDDIKSHHWDTFYDFYIDTCDRKWGDAYLNREFFHMIGESMSGKILLILAKNSLDGYVAGAWNCIGSDAMFGRNWGKRRLFECKNLHFELCYYQAIEAAIEMGLSRVEAGAQGEHKIQRGYLPKATYSAHYIRPNELRKRIQHITRVERVRLMEAMEYMEYSYSPFK